MAKITIDGADYEEEDLSQDAKMQLISLRFCDGELARVQAEAMAIQAARGAYANALKMALKEPANKSEGDKVPQNSGKEGEKKKGLFGLF